MKNIAIKLISLFIIITILFSFSACSTEEKNEPVTLTAEDMKYVDTVYDNMSVWDGVWNVYGRSCNIEKIMFCDFDYSGKMSFFIYVNSEYNYDVIGFFIYDGFEQMDFDVYDTDEKTRLSGWETRIAYDLGYDYDSSASDEAKYETLKDAFLFYKENNQ